MTRILRIYINNQFYKEWPVETIGNTTAYDPAPVIQMLIADKDAGLLNQFNIPPGTFPIRIELKNR
jgi:hypothetical protein